MLIDQNKHCSTVQSELSPASTERQEEEVSSLLLSVINGTFNNGISLISNKKLFVIILDEPHESPDVTKIEILLAKKSLGSNFDFLPEGFHVLQNLSEQNEFSGDMKRNAVKVGSAFRKYNNVYQLENVELWWLSGQVMKYGWEFSKNDKNEACLKTLTKYLRSGFNMFFQLLPEVMRTEECRERYFKELELFLKDPFSSEGMAFKNWIVLEERNKFFSVQLTNHKSNCQNIISIWGSAHFNKSHAIPLGELIRQQCAHDIRIINFSKIKAKINCG